MRQFLLSLLAGWIVFSWGSSASAEAPIIRVTGEATLSVPPDRATVDLGVMTEDPNAARAAERNAEKSSATIQGLRDAFGSALKIQTVNYSIAPRYRYPAGGGTREQDGFTASNIVRIKTRELDQVGRIIDIATSRGTNQVERLDFDLTDEEPTRSKALKKAATSARAKADAIAGALGLKVVRVISVEEGGVSIASPPASVRLMSKRSASVPTPVEAGTLDVHAQITLSVEAKP